MGLLKSWLLNESEENDNTPRECYGVKGMDSKPWRKTFKNQAECEKWVDANDAEIHGTRFLTNEEAELEDDLPIPEGIPEELGDEPPVTDPAPDTDKGNPEKGSDTALDLLNKIRSFVTDIEESLKSGSVTEKQMQWMIKNSKME